MPTPEQRTESATVQPPLFATPEPQLVPVYLLWSDRYGRPAMRGSVPGPLRCFVCEQCAMRLMRELFPAALLVRGVLASIAGACRLCGGFDIVSKRACWGLLGMRRDKR